MGLTSQLSRFVIIGGLFVACGCLHFRDASNEALDSGLLAHWPLDECIHYENDRCVSVEVRDSVMNAVVFGGRRTRGRLRNGIRLDGDDDFVLVTQKDYLDRSIRSVQFWFMKTNDTIESVPGKFAREGLVVRARDTGMERGFYFALAGARAPFSLGFYASAMSREMTLPGVFSAELIEPRRWYHVVGTIDSDSLRLFIDGDLAGSAEFEGEPMVVPVPIVFGKIAYYSESKRYFQGLLDDVRLYGRILSQREIRSLAASTP